MFFWIPAAVDDNTSVNPNGTKTLLANTVSIFSINGKSNFVNGERELSDPPFWLIILLVALF